MAVEGLSRLQTLKRKVRYNEVNEVAEKRLAGSWSIQGMEIPTEESVGTQRHGIQTMEVDNLC